jgi:hypothetical protein
MAFSGPATTALATLKSINYQLVEFGSSFYVSTPSDRAGMTTYCGKKSDDFWTGMSNAAIAGLAIAQTLVANQAANLALGPILQGLPGSRAGG